MTPEPQSTALIYAIIGFAATQAAAVIFLLAKELLGSKKSEFKRLEDALTKNTDQTVKNTVAVEVLTYKVADVSRQLEEVGELRRDVGKMGETIRKKMPSDT
jgi:hypothetical protein